MRTLLGLSVFCFLLAARAGWAQMPSTIGYQGVLTDANGVVVADGPHSISFRLYDAPTGGTALWTETQPVNTTNGVFQAVLGSVTALTIGFDRQLWLSITVSGDTELSPRTQLTATAYSLIAGAVTDDAVSGTAIADGTVAAGDIGSGQVVKSVNGLKDDVILSGGTNVTISAIGDTLRIAASPGGGGNTLDQAYDQGGSGAGRRITADAGAVDIAGSGGLVVEGAVGVGVSVPSASARLHVKDGSVLVEGTTGGLPATGGGARLMWYPAKAAFRAGQVTGTQWDDASVGFQSTVSGGIDNAASGAVSAVGGGSTNTAGGDSTTVGGGSRNVAGNTSATVSGGILNTAGGPQSFVGGGTRNQASGQQASIGGGNGNTASATQAAVSGGFINMASGQAAAIGGGTGNQASGQDATIGGGNSNQAAAQTATVGGGGSNISSATYGTIAGGLNNRATDEYGTVGGGQNNRAGDNAGATSDQPHATVGGGFNNIASAQASTIGGGSANTASARHSVVSGGESNAASGIQAVAGGGLSNAASAQLATVGGGTSNTASGFGATVSGGNTNTASGASATIPGGLQNVAAGENSFAAGRQAKVNALHSGAFLYADNSVFDFNSGASNEFAVRATGGVRFVSGIDGSGNATAGVELAAGGGSWSSISDRNAKANFQTVDGKAVLNRLLQIPIQTWNYKAQDLSIRHMGPMAQDFYAAFELGKGDKRIATVDADGVAFAAIQGLYGMVKEKEAQIQALQQKDAVQQAAIESLQRAQVELRAKNRAQQVQVEALQEQGAALQERLAALETLLKAQSGENLVVKP